MLAAEGWRNAAAFVQLVESDLSRVVDLRGHPLEHLEKLVARTRIGAGSCILRFENGGLLSHRAACERLSVLADGVTIHPPETFAEAGLLVFGCRRQNVIHMTVHERRFRACGVSRGNDEIHQRDNGLVLVIVEKLRSPRSRWLGRASICGCMTM